MNIRYHFNLSDPRNPIVKGKLTLENVSVESISIVFPLWRPGRYTYENYPKFLLDVYGEAARNEMLALEKTALSTYRLSTKGHTTVHLHFSYYCWYPTAGGSMVAHDLIYLNFVNFAPYVLGYEDEGLKISLDFPDYFKVACALPFQPKQEIEIPNIHRLYDCPLLASPILESLEVHVKGIPITWAWYGEANWDKEKLKNDLAKFASHQIDVFGSFPKKSYYFLVLTFTEKKYHGVEHADSTVLAYGPGSDFNKDSHYYKLIELASHEFFHAWNAKKIYPSQLHRFNYIDPVMLDQGYIIEGLTTYYGDYEVIRSGIQGKEYFLNTLGQIMENHFKKVCPSTLSLMDSGKDLWLDGYELSAPGRKMSIYNEGALAAMCLDLLIRKKSSNEKSLDDVLRIFYLDSQQAGYKGLTNERFAEVIEQFLGEITSTVLNKLYRTKGGPGKEFINECLSTVGLALGFVPYIDDRLASKAGLALKTSNDGDFVDNVHPLSPLYHLLEVGDEVRSVEYAEDSTHNLSILKLSFLDKYNQVKKVEVNLPKKTTFWKKIRVIELDTLDRTRQANLLRWLNLQ